MPTLYGLPITPEMDRMLTGAMKQFRIQKISYVVFWVAFPVWVVAIVAGFVISLFEHLEPYTNHTMFTMWMTFAVFNGALHVRRVSLKEGEKLFNEFHIEGWRKGLWPTTAGPDYDWLNKRLAEHKEQNPES